MTPLIQVEELGRRLSEVVVCDVRWSLTDPDHGATAYDAGHIPGAVFVDLDRDLTGKGGGRHPLPEPVAFTGTLGRLGITPETEVVVYDDASGAFATRLWWMLRSIGHERSRLLDGGIQAWVGAELPLSTRKVAPAQAVYPGAVFFRGVVEVDDLADRALLDVRAAERYRGEVEPIDPKAGHIPGAVNIPAAGNVGGDGLFLAPSDLAALYHAVPPDPVVSCGSGITACQTALSLLVSGRPMPDVYIGSFSEWSRLDRPVATGEQP